MAKKYKYFGHVVRNEQGTLCLFLHGSPYKIESEVGQGEWTNDEWDGVVIRPTDFEMVKWEDKNPTPVIVSISIDEKMLK